MMWTTQEEFVMITEIIISRIKSTVFPGIIKNVELFHCRIRTKIQSGNGHNVGFFSTSHLILSKVRSGTLHYYTNEPINRGEKKICLILTIITITMWGDVPQTPCHLMIPDFQNCDWNIHCSSTPVEKKAKQESVF